MTLLEILDEIPLDYYAKAGLCAFIWERLTSVYDYSDLLGQARDLFVLWPEYSGDPNYPVPSPNLSLTAEQAYYASSNLWDRETPYGALRWELVEFMKEQLR